jgi:hypothetical protein
VLGDFLQENMSNALVVYVAVTRTLTGKQSFTSASDLIRICFVLFYILSLKYYQILYAQIYQMLFL